MTENNTDTEDPIEIIPYLEADIPKGIDDFLGSTLTLSGGRTIYVGYGVNDGGRIIDIRRPTNDGKISQMKFAITKEGALALLFMLDKSFEHEDANPRPTHPADVGG